MTRQPHDIIIKPVLTERSYDGIANKKYTFMVRRDATKVDIGNAIEEIFGVQVDRVNTLRQMGKMKRQGRTQGRRPEYKKAFVKLKPESNAIEFFEGMA